MDRDGSAVVVGGANLSVLAKLKAAAAARDAGGDLDPFMESSEARYGCKFLVEKYKECSKRWGGEGAPQCAYLQEQLEPLCGQFKSSWSGWWTEIHDQDECHLWKKIYRQCDSPDRCKWVKEFYERVCRTRLAAPQQPPPSTDVHH